MPEIEGVGDAPHHLAKIPKSNELKSFTTNTICILKVGESYKTQGLQQEFGKVYTTF